MVVRLAILLAGLVPFVHVSSAKDDNIEREFVKAAVNGDLHKVRLFLKNGASINARTPEGYTALMLAAGKGQLDVVRFLVKQGADINAQAVKKETALHLAAAFGQKEIVGVLLSHKADFRITDRGLTPLMMAVAGGHSQVADLLLSKGENVNAKQPDGWTVLMHAMPKGDRDTVLLLLAHKADAAARNKDGKAAVDIAEEYHHKEIVELLKRPGNSNQK